MSRIESGAVPANRAGESRAACCPSAGAMGWEGLTLTQARRQVTETLQANQPTANCQGVGFGQNAVLPHFR
jgi:hypothetical protein